jgi:hypothetical protein
LGTVADRLAAVRGCRPARDHPTLEIGGGREDAARLPANGQPAVENAVSEEEPVSTAALLAAMELVRGLSANPAATPGDQRLDDIRQAAIRPAELTKAFADLLYGFLQVFEDADLDLIVGSVTRRLRRLA